MSKRRDRFMEDMGRIRRARQRRRAQREQERLIDEDKPAVQETWEDLRDGVEFRSREFGALGKELARGTAREAGNVAAGVFKEGVDLTVDFLTTFVTLGLAPQSSPMNGKHRRRRR